MSFCSLQPKTCNISSWLPSYSQTRSSLPSWSTLHLYLLRIASVPEHCWSLVHLSINHQFLQLSPNTRHHRSRPSSTANQNRNRSRIAQRQNKEHIRRPQTNCSSALNTSASSASHSLSQLPTLQFCPDKFISAFRNSQTPCLLWNFPCCQHLFSQHLSSASKATCPTCSSYLIGITLDFAFSFVSVLTERIVLPSTVDR